MSSSMKHKKTIVSFSNNEERLFGILHHPINNTLSSIPMIIFSHGFAGYRTGPHQLFVKVARALTNQGYSCLRFDFRGRGYSDGKREHTNYQSMVSDLDVVIQTVNTEYNPSHIILLGICSGARTALYYTKNGSETIHSLIELSSPYLWVNNEVSAVSSRTKNIVSGYIQKSKNIDNWKRLIRGELNLRMIKKIFRHNLREYWLGVKRSTSSKTKRTTNKQKTEKQSFLNFKGEVMLIHGEKDPETAIAMKQIHSLLHKHQINYKDLVIENANHSFYSLRWEEEIIGKICNWLKVRFTIDQHS